LKQGDPSVYARTGEEILHFRSHGYEPVIIPGVSSALAGPVFSGIPLTQRGVAESFIVCTGAGRKGKEVKLPGYERGRSLVILMGVARLPQVLESLTGDDPERLKRDGTRYPSYTPIALVERASMPDQRVVEGTLQSIETAMASAGEQRPPGMLIIGWSCLALWGEGDTSILDDAEEGETKDRGRVAKWLRGERWRIREGLDADWEEL
jgi:uroporphyrin-III C-methyltransferase